MKKTFLSLALALGLLGAAQAQSITFGAKVGASLTNVTGKNTEGFDNKFGFHGGLIANFAVNDAFSVQPELLYSMKGAKAASSGTFGGITSSQSINNTLHYIDVPVLARIKADALFFELGPQIGFLAAAKSESSLTINGSTTTSNSTDKSDLNSVDFGYAAGLGYQLEGGPGIGLRYNGGFTDINKNNGGGNATRNSAFQLYVSYMFGGK